MSVTRYGLPQKCRSMVLHALRSPSWIPRGMSENVDLSQLGSRENRFCSLVQMGIFLASDWKLWDNLTYFPKKLSQQNWRSCPSDLYTVLMGFLVVPNLSQWISTLPISDEIGAVITFKRRICQVKKPIVYNFMWSVFGKNFLNSYPSNT